MLSFAVEIAGHRYKAAWKSIDCDRFELRSDYGSRTMSLEGRDPSAAARETMQSIVAKRV